MRQRGEEPLQVLVGHKFLEISHRSFFWDVPVMRAVSGEKPGVQQARVVDTKYTGLSVHIHTRILPPSVKQH